MALTLLDLRGHAGAWDEVLPRPPDPGADVREAVAGIVSKVRAEGDQALRELTERFEGVVRSEPEVARDEVASAPERVSFELREALSVAWERICAYHSAEADQGGEHLPYEQGGVVVRDLVRPVARVGCYAPGGRARYPSTVLMCAAPARVAGVAETLLCVPPGPDGRVDDATLAAAAVAGVHKVYALGGAQAVAAMAYGTASVPAVDVVVGPGNRYVAEAKRQVSGVVGIPGGFAGPSEVVVVAGPDTPAELAAIDLVVQAEHGPDGLAWLVTWSPGKAEEVAKEVARITESSPRRADLERTLATGGYACLVDGPTSAIEVANAVAPEHLELLVEQADALLPSVRAAGAVFCGLWSPASLGDYIAGPNHILPTNRTARFASGLRTEDFRRHVHVVTATRPALSALGPHVVTLATTEGLPAHADAIRMRT